MLQHSFPHSPHRGTNHRRYKATTTRAPACPARRADAATADQARRLANAEQAAYDAHSAAYDAWQADPANAVKQAAVSATYQTWQAARLACGRARNQRPGLFPNFNFGE